MNEDNLIDFPCSYSWRAYYQETIYGEYLPALEPDVPIEGTIVPNVGTQKEIPDKVQVIYRYMYSVAPPIKKERQHKYR